MEENFHWYKDTQDQKFKLSISKRKFIDALLITLVFLCLPATIYFARVQQTTQLTAREANCPGREVINEKGEVTGCSPACCNSDSQCTNSGRNQTCTLDNGSCASGFSCDPASGTGGSVGGNQSPGNAGRPGSGSSSGAGVGSTGGTGSGNPGTTVVPTSRPVASAVCQCTYSEAGRCFSGSCTEEFCGTNVNCQYNAGCSVEVPCPSNPNSPIAIAPTAEPTVSEQSRPPGVGAPQPSAIPLPASCPIQQTGEYTDVCESNNLSRAFRQVDCRNNPVEDFIVDTCSNCCGTTPAPTERPFVPYELPPISIAPRLPIFPSPTSTTPIGGDNNIAPPRFLTPSPTPTGRPPAFSEGNNPCSGNTLGLQKDNNCSCSLQAIIGGYAPECASGNCAQSARGGVCAPPGVQTVGPRSITQTEGRIVEYVEIRVKGKDRVLATIYKGSETEIDFSSEPGDFVLLTITVYYKGEFNPGNVYDIGISVTQSQTPITGTAGDMCTDTTMQCGNSERGGLNSADCPSGDWQWERGTYDESGKSKACTAKGNQYQYCYRCGANTLTPLASPTPVQSNGDSFDATVGNCTCVPSTGPTAACNSGWEWKKGTGENQQWKACRASDNQNAYCFVCN